MKGEHTMKITELKNLQAGEIIEVKGSLMYAKHLTKKLEGEELEARIKADSKVLEYVNENPRFEFQLFDPAVVKKGAKPTDAEIYVKGKIYEDKNGQKIMRCDKTAKSEKSFLLTGVRQADGKIKKVNLAGKSLENEQPVTVQYKCDTYKKSNGKEAFGINLFAVIFEEEPKLWVPSNNNLPDGWEMGDEEEAETETPETTAPAEAEAAPAPAEAEAPAAEEDENVWAD